MAFAGKGKRVLIIVENLPLPFDRRVWQEANTLKAAGYQVFIISPKGKNYTLEYEKINGIEIFRHPLPLEGSGALGFMAEYGVALFWQFVLALRIYRRYGFDVIQACNPPDTIFLVGLFFKLLFKTRFVFDHHDINPELYLAKFGKKDYFYRLLLLLERLTFGVADCSIATNLSYRDIAVERGKMDPRKVTVVRSGPSLERMRKIAPRPEWKNGRKYLVGYLGVMGEQEGIHHLIEAARILVFDRERDDVQFVLVGDGTAKKRVERLARECHLHDRVTFTGRVPDDKMLEILNTADICVNPDIANDMNDKSTMNKIMEYMAIGKPIVQYDLREGRFSAREASLYAERNSPGSLADSIERLLNDAALRRKMGCYGDNRVRNELHWGIEAPKYLSVYDRLFRPSKNR